jgi:hypothetical protein
MGAGHGAALGASLCAIGINFSGTIIKALS